MMGMKMSVAQNMIPNVRWLDTLSQTVRLACGNELEGMTNGNMDAPAVPMTPTRVNDEATKAVKVKRKRSSSAASKAHVTPRAGSNHRIGNLT